MKKLITIFFVFFTVFCLFTPLSVFALDVENGQQVVLKARRIDLGVPLHRNSYPSMFGRVNDGTVVEVLGTANNKHWLNIKTPSGKIGWVIDFYVGSKVLNLPVNKRDLRDTNLEGVNFTGADLRDTNLEGVNFTGADLRDTNLEGVNFTGADLRDTNLEGVNLEGVNLTGADFRGANLEGVNFTGADLRDTNLEGVNLEGVNLTGADLRDTNLEGVNLEGVNLTGADLRGANLGDSNLHLDIFPSLPGDPITPPPPPKANSFDY